MFDIDRRHQLAVAVCALLLGVCSQLSAQIPGALPSPGASAPDVPDPFGRDSPFGTVTGFSAAVHREDFALAARYLQVEGRSAQQVENLARDLSELLDRYFTQPLSSVSRLPGGTLPVHPHAGQSGGQQVRPSQPG